MPANISIAAAMDKGKLASNVVYLALLEIDVLDLGTKAVIGTQRFVHNNEAFIFQGNSYAPVGIDFKVNYARGEMPTINLEVVDTTLAMQGLMQEYQGGADFPVRILIVSTANPNVAESENAFTILSSSSGSDTYRMTFELGAENPLGLRFPWTLMFRNRCRFKYRSEECGYVGAMPTCDFTKNGPNGCIAHSNVDSYGGYGSLGQGG